MDAFFWQANLNLVGEKLKNKETEMKTILLM